MPLITILPSHTAQPATEDLLTAITVQAAQALSKPERVMMVRAEAPQLATHGGLTDPSCAFVVRTGGPPNRAQREACLKVLTGLASGHLGVEEGRCFVIFEPVARDHWAVRTALLE